MKKIFPLILSLLFCIPGLSQEKKPRNLTAFDLKKLHFGFTVGLNSMDLGIRRNYEADQFIYADLTKVLPGFQVSIVSDLRINKNWNLRFLPGISFGSRELYYYEYAPQDGGPPVSLLNADNPVALGPSFLDFPLHLKYRSERVNNYRPYIVGGLNFRYDMSSKKEYDGDSNEYVRFKPADLYLEFGFGVDTYLRYFKFAPEIKLAIGFRNIISDDPREPYLQFVESIDRVTSFIVMLNFHFE
ncbi:MAG: PorT family protein [Bacteroidetes bacterium]|nr:MAG: PorT family protein [Bacteroidota bacterium]